MLSHHDCCFSTTCARHNIISSARPRLECTPHKARIATYTCGARACYAYARRQGIMRIHWRVLSLLRECLLFVRIAQNTLKQRYDYFYWSHNGADNLIQLLRNLEAV